MIITKKFIVVRADGSARVVSKAQRLRIDEIAVPLEITVPDAWGEIDVTQMISVEMPQPPTVTQPKAKRA